MPAVTTLAEAWRNAAFSPYDQIDEADYRQFEHDLDDAFAWVQAAMADTFPK